jgi:hypothetical protein
MPISLRIGLAIALLGLGTVFAFAAGYAYGEVLPASSAALIPVGDGASINVLTGAFVPR